jgi:DNA helicase II / ATP-dependent DNA helicase PcrA
MNENAELNKQQQLAVNTDGGPVLVIAGAGTGKTRVIVERISRLISSGTSPSRLLALTFTEKAAAEMLDRVNEARGTYELELPIMTFNAYGESLLRRYAADIGLGRNFSVIGDSAQIVFLRERIDALELDYFAPLSRPDGLLSDIADYFSQLKQNVVTPQDYHAFVKNIPTEDMGQKLDKKKHRELANAYEAYMRLCREANVIDYDDQIYLLIELFRQRPNVLKEVQESYDYVMVDEFQDTNTMQSVLVDMIAGKEQNLFVVGDDDQSIYGWRGATLANILDFKNHYKDAKEITLIQNYRSTKEILDSAYRLIMHNNPHRLEERLNINKQLKTERTGLPPSIYFFITLDEELQWIAEDIKRRVTEGVSPGSIAVLARRNATIQRLHTHLDYLEVDHAVIGQRYELYKDQAVRVLLEAIKATVDPLDNTSLYHTLTGPIFSLSTQILGQAASSARRQHQSLQETIDSSEEAEMTDAKKTLEQIKEWREKSSVLTVGKLAYEILTDSGYKDRLYTAAQTDVEAAVAIGRLSELFNILREFEQIALQPSAVQFIDSLPALQAAGDGGEDGTLDLSSEKVNILSIHKAKGLEWPVVYIADCTEGSFPLRESSRGIAMPDKFKANHATEADDHMAEERRLMYVAMTRAKDELILTHAERHTSASVRKPSRFLTEAFKADEFKIMQASGRVEIGTFSAVQHSTIGVPPHILNGSEVILTVSQAKKYIDCPLDFYYSYVLNVPQEPDVSQEYGSLMHSLLEDINNSLLQGYLIPLTELATRLENEWPKSGYLSAQQKERAFKQGQVTLKNLYARIMAEKRIPLAVEEPFSFSLKESHLSVRGRFDVVFPLDGSVEIVDYKTSSSVDSPEKAKQRANTSEQLTLYALAWQLQHDQLPSLVSLEFIDTGMTGSLKKTQRGLDSAVARLQKVADGIRAGNFEPGKNHLFCSHPPIN